MSAYTFNQIPQLKKALEEGDIQTALDLVPIVDIKNDKYEYLALLREIQSIFLLYYKTNNQLALTTTVELIAKSENLYYTSHWPQFTDLVSNSIAIIGEMDISKDKENILKAILGKLALKDSYVANHSNLNYNLACYYAKNEDVKTMMEYVLRASFSFEAKKFISDKSFEKYKEEPFFLKPLESLGHTMFTWWTCIWPIEEWYEDL